MPSTRTIIASLLMVAMAAMLVLGSGCRLVGSGTLGYVTNVHIDPVLHVPAQPAAVSGSAVTVKVFRPNPGDAWPPPGQLGLWLHADSIPAFRDPYGGMPADDPWLSTLVLVRLFRPSEPVDEASSEYRSCDEIKGDGSLWTRDHEFGRIVLTPDPAQDRTAAPSRVLNALLTIDDTPENGQASWVLATEMRKPPWSPWSEPWGLAIRCGTITVPPP